MALKEGQSPISAPLPGAGGGQSSVGSNFEVDLSTGVGSYQLPLAFPPGRHQTPSLALSYSTGHGNGLLGLGWSLGTPVISRSEIDGQPHFDDTKDSFTYGGQRLVPVGNGQYRQEIEQNFYRFRYTGTSWEVQTKDGDLLRFGPTPAGRLTLALERPNPIYQWWLESSEDTFGNRITYRYAQEDGWVRLVEMTYGPYSIRLAYEGRPDPVSSYNLGVKRFLQQRLIEISLWFVPNGQLAQPIKAYRLSYEQAAFSGLSRLVGVQLVSLDATGEEAAGPPIRFEYTDIQPQAASLRPLVAAQGVVPPAVSEAGLTLLDIEGNGLPGFLSLSANGGQYWPNLGNLKVGAARALRHFPTALAERPESVRVASVSEHGLLDLVVAEGTRGSAGYYALQPGGSWETFRPFRRPPALSLLDPRTHFVDLNFDGRADLLYADERAFYTVINQGAGDFAPPQVTLRQHDHRLFPDVDLADPHIFLANMSGGPALVEVRDHSVTYWPSLGDGRWGAAVQMASPPDLPPGYASQRLFLADLDGNGLADLIYVDQNRVLLWFNQSGQGFSPPTIIERTPSATANGVLLTDLTGQGQAGLLWSGATLSGGRAAHYFLDLSRGEQSAFAPTHRDPQWR